MGSGVAVKRSVDVGEGSTGVLDGRGVLLGTVVAVTGGEAGGVAVFGLGGLVGGWLVGAGVLVFTGGVGVLLAPGCGVMVGSDVTETVGSGVDVLEGVKVGAEVAVWALAVSVAAITVCTMGGNVWVGTGVGVGQATGVGARSQYRSTRAVLRVVRLLPSAVPYRPGGRRNCWFWLLRNRQLLIKQSSANTAVSPS